MTETAVRKIARRKTRHEGDFTLQGSDKIDRPGIYDISMEKYHGDCCVGLSVSGTDLWTIESKSLRHYWAQSYLAGDKRVRKSSKATEFGKAAHYLQLGEHFFKQHFIEKPWPSFSDDVKRKWRDEHEAAGFGIVTKDDMVKIRGMAEVLAEDPIAAVAFKDGRPEMSICWQDEDTGIWCKTRPDWLPNTDPKVANFKTTTNAEPGDWSRNSLYPFGNHVKEAMRVDGFKAIGRPCTPFFVVQESNWPHVITPVYCTPHDIERGRLIYKSALRKLAKAHKEGYYPAYTDPRRAETAIAVAEMPHYMIADIDQRIRAGEFGPLEGER